LVRQVHQATVLAGGTSRRVSGFVSGPVGHGAGSLNRVQMTAERVLEGSVHQSRPIHEICQVAETTCRIAHWDTRFALARVTLTGGVARRVAEALEAYARSLGAKSGTVRVGQAGLVHVLVHGKTRARVEEEL